MHSVKQLLQGYQLSLMPTVQAYWMENPRFASEPLVKEMSSTPEQSFEVGDRVRVGGKHGYSSVLAGMQGTVIELAGSGAGYWMRFVDRKQLMLPTELERIQQTSSSTPEQSSTSEQPKRKRRHSPKGQATGWIEERVGNKHRKKPTISYFYCWYAEQDEELQKMRRYIPAKKVYPCQQMVEQRCLSEEILRFLGG